jgi:hypothetical protein
VLSFKFVRKREFEGDPTLNMRTTRLSIAMTKSNTGIRTGIKGDGYKVERASRAFSRVGETGEYGFLGTGRALVAWMIYLMTWN